MGNRVTVPKSMTSTVTLKDGTKMPMFGLGVYLSDESACTKALDAGYRMIDTAQMYKNEADVGRAVKKCGLARKDVFVVSKVFMDNHGEEKARKSIEESLKQLDIEYIDLFLIHSPEPGKVLETYDVILDFQKKGLIKSVGVSNFGIHHLEELKKAGKRCPTVNQFELHAWRERKPLIEYCRKNGIAVMGFSPLGTGKPLKDEKLADIAKKYERSSAQILIRWSIQKGFITIPKASSQEHIVENSKVFEFSLSAEDMEALGNFEEKTFWGPFQGVESEWKG